jgi:hypothetical protein
MKKCFKCHEDKPLSEFYKHPMMADGHLNKCKECNKRDVKQNREKRIDYYREKDRERARLRLKEPNKYKPRQFGPKMGPLVCNREYMRRFPIKKKAREAVAYAVRVGKMKRMPCEKCGDEKSHAHHDDYAYPLSVRWLCHKHHFEWHHKNGPGKNGGDESYTGGTP